MKPRHHLYLDEDLTVELEHLASKPGSSKSAIVTAALRQYIRRGGADERDEAIRQRFDRLSRQVAKLTSDMELVLNTQSQHVWLNLLLTANVPSPDETGRRTALQRYDKFTESVAALVAKSRAADVDVPPHDVHHQRSGSVHTAHPALSNAGGSHV
ncbi:CopG family transcriptional regulator [Asticcacaulis taihuensis]|uniref:ribbon-helix-helix domain-containing protein n=1 Tax=Asticcacaulis taihuensis TaxID=260084 RepID=UPI003F7C1AAB